MSVATLVVAVAVAACSASASPSPAPSVASTGGVGPVVASPAPVSASPVPASPSAAASPATSFPLTLTDDEGTSVTIPREPARVVSLSPAVTETVFALGRGSRLVGRTSSDDYPAAAASVPVVATFNGVETEKVVAQHPDLVIAGGNGLTPAKDIASMRRLGLLVVVVYAPTMNAVIGDIELVGRAIGAGTEADALGAQLTGRIDAIAQAANAAGSRPRTFYEVDATKQIFGPAKDSFVAQMVQLAGGDPITSDDPTVWSISLERLVAADPQVIVLGDAAYGTTAAAVTARPGWGVMSAVKAGAIRPVDDTIVTRPGPRIADGLAALAESIHPGLALPSAAASPAAVSAGPSAAPASPAAAASGAP